ncbi:flagellar biosynthetic protein FliO [Agaribacterium sp. ZY112]|uniref:flagellar biosynthetic protein FliO n=1 Tax=Agaribacterium sp. ZY112 TaxID=3233574 RepID=UPI00352633E1
MQKPNVEHVTSLAPTEAASSLSYADMALQVGVVLSLIVALILALAWLSKRLPISGIGAGRLKVLETLNLGRKERIVLLKAGSDTLVLSVADGAITKLHELNDTPPLLGDESNRSSCENTEPSSEVKASDFSVESDFSGFLKRVLKSGGHTNAS